MVNQAVIGKSLATSLQIKETATVLVFSVLLPFFMHFIPTAGLPAGAVLLPIFIAPFIAVIFFRWHVSVIAALLSPILNHLVTGNPALGILGVITTELVLFVLFSIVLLRVTGLKFAAAPISLIASMSVAHILFSRFDHLANTLIHGMPGIALLLVVNILALIMMKKLK